MADQTKTKDLWAHRSVAETKAIYADWADTYEDDVTALGYATPDRIAQALAAQDIDKAQPILDFGCGTGLSGVALRRHGFTTVDGTDISPEMLEHARQKTDVYRRLWLGDPNHFDIKTGAYETIVATGVISLGAAPPELLVLLLDVIEPGGHLALSYNDPTLADASYMDALNTVETSKIATTVFREHGPHLSEKITGSDVIVLRRL